MTNLDRRPDWEKFPYRWCYSDGGYVYFPGGNKHHDLPEEVKKAFSLAQYPTHEKDGQRFAISQSESESEEKSQVHEVAQERRPLLDARGIVDVRI